MSVNKFNGDQLLFALDKRRVSQTLLSEQIGLTPKQIRKYVNGEVKPKDGTVKKLSEILDFPVEFFYLSSMKKMEEENLSYRAKSNLKASDRRSAERTADLAISIHEYIADRIELFDLDVPCYITSDSLSPEDIALNVRAEWGLDVAPIDNMLMLLELKGIRVFALPQDIEPVDAFSFWHDGEAFIVMNLSKSAERSRFDLAHELGHLVMHKFGYNEKDIKTIEAEADRFASAFLMPYSALKYNLPKTRTLRSFIKVKQYWKVSFMALIFRLNRTGLISDWIYRNLAIEASRQGYRKQELYGISREPSNYWQRVLEIFRESKLDINAFSKAVNLSKRDIMEIVCQFTPEDKVVKLPLKQKITTINVKKDNLKPKTDNVVPIAELLEM